jgi:hypothetical protein
MTYRVPHILITTSISQILLLAGCGGVDRWNQHSRLVRAKSRDPDKREDGIPSSHGRHKRGVLVQMVGSPTPEVAATFAVKSLGSVAINSHHSCYSTNLAVELSSTIAMVDIKSLSSLTLRPILGRTRKIQLHVYTILYQPVWPP